MKRKKIIHFQQIKIQIRNSKNINNNDIKNTNTKTDPGLSEEDKECLKYIKQKDYYKILNITKSAEENEIKKSYKKVIKIFIFIKKI